MNLPKLPSWGGVALKFAPYVALVIAAGLLFLSHGKVNSLKATVEARNTQVSALIESRQFFKTAVDQRDALINKQSASIDALADAAKVNRDVYVAGINAARVVSADHLKASSELLSLKAPDGELEQCRAARTLLESELVK